jgi:hypothetical protein
MLHDLLIYLTKEIYWIDERHILEFCLLIDGTKPVVRVPLRSDIEKNILYEFSKKFNLNLFISRNKTVVDFVNELGEQFVKLVDINSQENGEIVAYVSQSINKAIEAESSEYLGDNKKLASLLGYPMCCVDYYENKMFTEHWVKFLIENAKSKLPWECNKLAYALYGVSMFPDYFPCSLSCQKTKKLTLRSLKSLKKNGFYEIAERHQKIMKQPIFINQNYIYGLSGECNNLNIDEIEIKIINNPNLIKSKILSETAYNKKLLVFS